MNDEALPAGVYRDRLGYRAYVWHRGRTYSKRFRRDSTTGDLPPLETVTSWQRHTLADAERDLLPAHAPGTFAADAADYLKAVAALTTYAERQRDINLWIKEFGTRPRAEIRPLDIRIVRDRWLTKGPKLVQQWTLNPVTQRREQTWEPRDVPLSASAVNHRLRALENLWTVLDGRNAPNPVRQVPEAEEPDAPPRALPVTLVRAILEAMPPSKSAARLRALAWAGVPPSTLNRMDATMVDWDHATYWRPGRRKGKGTKGQRVPLTPDGLAAFEMVRREDAWKGGQRGKGNGRRTFRAACRQVEKAYAEAGTTINLEHVRPYDLRHSIATLTATTTDFAGTELLLGVTATTAKRYAAGAIDTRLAAAVSALAAAQQGQPAAAETKPAKRKARAKSQGKRTPRRPRHPQRPPHRGE